MLKSRGKITEFQEKRPHGCFFSKKPKNTSEVQLRKEVKHCLSMTILRGESLRDEALHMSNAAW
jgi:hypothetical protein